MIKRLSSTYFEFFLARYSYLIILIHIMVIAMYFWGERQEITLLVIYSLGSICFSIFLFLTDYIRLKKRITLANVFLDHHQLIINGNHYSFEQIESISPLLVSDGVNDKSAFNLIAIKLSDSSPYYFLDRPMNWKFKSPTVIVLSQFPELDAKIKEKRDVYTGLSSLK